MERGRIRSVVGGLDDQTDVVGTRLRVGAPDIEKAVLVKDPGVRELEFAVLPSSAAVLLAEPLVGELRLRVAINPFGQRVSGRPVDGPEVLLDVLAVIALTVGQAEQAFLEDRILAVPQADGQIEKPETVAESTQAVLAPAVRAQMSMLERKIVPGILVGRVILADRAPLPPGHVRPPEPPRVGRRRRLGQAGVFGGAMRSGARVGRLGVATGGHALSLTYPFSRPH